MKGFLLKGFWTSSLQVYQILEHFVIEHMFACLLQWFFIWKPSFVRIFQDVVRKLSGFFDTTGFGVYWLAAVTFSVFELNFATRGVHQDMSYICSISYHPEPNVKLRKNDLILWSYIHVLWCKNKTSIRIWIFLPKTPISFISFLCLGCSNPKFASWLWPDTSH